MSRTQRFIIALVASACLGFTGRGAWGQFNVIGPGSTVDGDIARGMGAYWTGAGLYNVNTAMSYSIWSNALLRQEYAYWLAFQQQMRRYHDLLQARREATIAVQTSRQERLSQAPTENDVIRGDALNFLVKRIADVASASGSPAVLRSATVAVPGGTIERAPLLMPSAGVVISSSRLTAWSEWPLLLRRPTLDAAARDFHRAIDGAMDAISNGGLRESGVDAVDSAVRQLHARLSEIAAAERVTDVNEARAFLHGLDRAVHSLRLARAERVLKELVTYGGTTVGDLVSFLTRSKLQFGPAETPAERDLYRTLHPLLARQFALIQTPEQAESKAE